MCPGRPRHAFPRLQLQAVDAPEAAAAQAELPILLLARFADRPTERTWNATQAKQLSTIIGDQSPRYSPSPCGRGWGEGCRARSATATRVATRTPRPAAPRAPARAARAVRRRCGTVVAACTAAEAPGRRPKQGWPGFARLSQRMASKDGTVARSARSSAHCWPRAASCGNWRIGPPGPSSQPNCAPCSG